MNQGMFQGTAESQNSVHQERVRQERPRLALPMKNT